MRKKVRLSADERLLLMSLESIDLSFVLKPQDLDWESLFATIREGVTHRKFPIREAAFEALACAFGGEVYAKKLDVSLQYQARLIPMLDLIYESDDRCRDLDLLLNKVYFSEKSAYQPILDWLESHRPQTQVEPWDDLMLLFKLKARFWEDRPKILARTLIKTLDHPNDWLRARIAEKLGEYARYLQRLKHARSIGNLLRHIARCEIERPGIAGSFLNRITDPGSFGQFIPGFNIKEWILDILERRVKVPEPEVIEETRYLTLAFQAHEILSQDPWAIRRLIDMGNPCLAVAAATDKHWPVEGMRPLLEELGDHSEPGIVWWASWHLAYHYGFLHPNGHRLGFVDLVDRFPEIDLFLMSHVDFETPKPQTPSAAALYPKERGQSLSDAVAWDWINRLLPPPYRRGSKPFGPKRLKERDRYTRGNETAVAYDFPKGYIYFCGDPDARRWSVIHFGLRGKGDWDPRIILADEASQR